MRVPYKAHVWSISRAFHDWHEENVFDLISGKVYLHQCALNMFEETPFKNSTIFWSEAEELTYWWNSVWAQKLWHVLSFQWFDFFFLLFLSLWGLSHVLQIDACGFLFNGSRLEDLWHIHCFSAHMEMCISFFGQSVCYIWMESWLLTFTDIAALQFNGNV